MRASPACALWAGKVRCLGWRAPGAPLHSGQTGRECKSSTCTLRSLREVPGWCRRSGLNSGPLTGQTCEIDINECVKSPCRNGASCQNTHGGYYCHCRAGYTGRHCENDVDDCWPSKCCCVLPSHSHGVTCTLPHCAHPCHSTAYFLPACRPSVCRR